MDSKPTLEYITAVAHKHDAYISDEAKHIYQKLPTKRDVDDMVSHAASLMKAVGLKTISGAIAKVEMAHYAKEKK